MPVWRLRSGVLYRSAVQPAGAVLADPELVADGVEPVESGAPVGTEVLPVDDGTETAYEVESPGGQATQFATGGVIPGPQGAPTEVLAHAGGTVIPTKKRRAS